MHSQYVIIVGLVAFIAGLYWVKRKIGVAIEEARAQMFTLGSFVVAIIYVGALTTIVGLWVGGRLALGISPVAAAQQQQQQR